jgi:hypothetical protein
MRNNFNYLKNVFMTDFFLKYKPELKNVLYFVHSKTYDDLFLDSGKFRF